MSANKAQSILSDMQPSKAIVRLAIPATLALLAKAVYNLVDTAYIGMLNSDIALTAVGVTVPLLLISQMALYIREYRLGFVRGHLQVPSFKQTIDWIVCF